MSSATRFGNNLGNSLGKIFTKTVFSVSNKMSPILVTRFLGNKSRNSCSKTFCQSVQTQQEEKTVSRWRLILLRSEPTSRFKKIKINNFSWKWFHQYFPVLLHRIKNIRDFWWTWLTASSNEMRFLKIAAIFTTYKLRYLIKFI